METAVVVLSAVCAVLFVLCVVFGVLAVRYGRKMNALLPDDEEQAAEVEIEDGVRYTKYGTEEKADGSPVVSHLENDIVLDRGRTYTVGKDKKIIPGKYAVLSASEKQAAFNLRIDGLVREVRHGDDIVLGEGDTICAVSHPVILR